MLLKIRNEKGEWIAVDVIKGEPGADGYTPIKGVDYFDGVDGKDGKDGYTPIKGIDYFDGAPGKDGKDGTITFEELTPEQKESLKGADGKDGYTPVKGIDYFDGAPGKDGADGAPGKDGIDGYTPIKGIDYFDGKDGKDGVNGVDGKDYILTDADKQEIAAMVTPSSGGGAKDSFFLDFTNATTANQPCDADMLEFIEYFQTTDDICVNIRDGLNNESGYYYPAMWQSTNKASSIALLKAVVNLNTINNENEFRIYMLTNSNGTWNYKYSLTTYTYQFVTSKNIKDYGYLTEEEVIALIEEHGGGGEALPSAEGVEF